MPGDPLKAELIKINAQFALNRTGMGDEGTFL
jgi:hypothetical protein